MLLTNTIRSLFKQLLEINQKSCSAEYSAMDSAFPQPQNDLGEDDTMRDALLRKAMEAERLQAYLERIVDRISDLEKYFECTKKGEHAEGTYSPRGGDYRMNQARDRLLRLQQEAKAVKNRITHLKCQIYHEF